MKCATAFYLARNLRKKDMQVVLVRCKDSCLRMRNAREVLECDIKLPYTCKKNITYHFKWRDTEVLYISIVKLYW
jgi:hypothetical protein